MRFYGASDQRGAVGDTRIIQKFAYFPMRAITRNEREVWIWWEWYELLEEYGYIDVDGFEYFEPAWRFKGRYVIS